VKLDRGDKSASVVNYHHLNNKLIHMLISSASSLLA